MIMAGVSLSLSFLAQGAGRSSHWFRDSQLAYNLADTGMKCALSELKHANSAARAAQAGPLSRALGKAFQAVSSGTTGERIRLLEADGSSGPTAAITAQLADLKGFSPALEVSLKVV